MYPLSPEDLLERVLTTRLLEPHLDAPGRALDLGGGTGPYSVWLAELGWDVTLTELSPGLLALLPARTVRHVVEIDARDLSRWAGGTFDAVLSLGPMPHLTTTDDRARAADEIARVLRPGGLVAVAPHVFGVEPTDVAAFFESHGFASVLLASTHGFLTGVEDRLEALRLEHPTAYLQLLDLLVATASDPGALGTGGHLVYVGRRQDPTSSDS